MKRKFGYFSVIFGMGLALFTTLACSTPNIVWCSSSGILTYNRHTGQFELLWENVNSGHKTVHDTIYVYRDSTMLQTTHDY